jgi:glutamate 5-kinase
MIIANSSDIGVMHRILDGENVGTLFKANPSKDFHLATFVDGLHKNS